MTEASIFMAALDKPTEAERAAFLADACAGDERLRRRVVALLRAHAEPDGGGTLCLRAWIGLPDGAAWVSDELLGDPHDPEALGRDIAARLNLAGAGELLTQAEEMASRA